MERYTAMALDAVVMKSKTLICDIVSQVMDIDLEMRLSRFVTTYRAGAFDDVTASGGLLGGAPVHITE